MGNEQALELISAKFGESISHEIDAHGLLNLTVAPDQLIDLVTFLRDDETLAMGFLTTLCGIHYPFNKGAELGVVYHIHSLENNYRIRIKVFVPEEQPTCLPSPVCSHPRTGKKGKPSISTEFNSMGTPICEEF